MRVFTIRQPWAWAIARGFKNVENRTRAFNYTGPLMIHAGAQLADTAAFEAVEELAPVPLPQIGTPGCPTELALGAVIAVTTITGVHRSEDCNNTCSPWALPYSAHHVLGPVRILRQPVKADGRLNLWRPNDDLIAAVRRQLP